MTSRSVAVLLCAFALGACEKNGVQDITGTLPGSRVMFFNFGVGAPDVNFYANDTKMTAVLSTDTVESTRGTAYGAAAAGGRYTGIAPGQYTLSGRITDTTNKGLAISSVTTTLADGKFYSYYQSGFYDSTAKRADAFLIEDAFPPDIDYTVAYVRFVNAIGNANPLTLYATNTSTTEEVVIGDAVPYKGASAFKAVPGAVYNLAARESGSSTNAVSRTAVSFSAGRVYTVTARGDITVTSTTAPNRPFLDNTANR
jgi:hypothetical protein